VRFHYHPIAVEADAAPAAAIEGRDAASRVFAAVSLADKLDTLAGYFGIGESPTGSRDPFGLRRAGQGAVRAVLDFWRAQPGEPVPDLEAFARAAAAGHGPSREPPARVAEALASFLQDRLAYVLVARGFAADEVAAVLGAPLAKALADLADTQARVRALQRARRENPADLQALGEAFKRAKNILAQAPAATAIEPALFENDAEGALAQAVGRLGEARGSYEDRLRGLAALRAPVARFFDDVLVMAEDPRVRANRLALLDQTLSLFYRIADISRLGGQS
jgi:glycyl-tRNA synthetase beta chain